MGAPDINIINEAAKSSPPIWQIVTAGIGALGVIIAAWLGIKRKN